MDQKQKQQQKENFDSRHCAANDLPPIPDDTEVWITTDNEPVHARKSDFTGKSTTISYIVAIPSGQIERNRSHLTVVPRLG